MRIGAYQLFEIVSWPALVWCAIELSIRTVTFTPDGMAGTALLGSMAAACIVASRWRSRQLAVASAHPG